MDPKCHYCAKGEPMETIGLEIAQLGVSTLYLFREQSHPGRCIVAYKDHVSELVDLDDAQRNAYFADVARAARAIHAAYKPAKINYAAFGDLMPHLHFHLVPKYSEGYEWGSIFQINPQQVTLTDHLYREAVEKIRQAL